MEKKIKDLTEEEFQLICKHYGGDCSDCPLLRIAEGAEDDHCAYKDCQEYIDIVDACRKSIIIRFISDYMNISKPYYLVEYYKNDERHKEKFNTLDEANARYDELLKEFDSQGLNINENESK